MAINQTQPMNQKPTGNLYMDSSGKTYGSSPFNMSTINVPTTIDGSQINTNPQQFQYPTGTNNNNLLNSYISSLVPQINQANTNQTNAEGTYNTSNQSLIDLMNQLGNQTSDTQALENQAGLPNLNKELRDLRTLQTQQLAGYINNINQNDVNATGMTRTAQTGNEAQITRQHGIDALLTSSLIQAKEGNIASAQANVDRAINAKYEPIKNSIAIQNQIIKNNYEMLTRTDKKLADLKTQENDFKLKLLDREAQTEKDVNAIMLEAAKNGASNSILALMKNARTVGEAIQSAGGFIEDKLARALQRAQLAKLNAETTKALSEVSKNGPQGATELKANALQTAQQIRESILNGTARGAIGAKGFSSLFGLKEKPFAGTDAAAFVNLYDNFKALLSLDNIKYLKGQGAVSDAERKTLEQASSKLNRSTSEVEFNKILNEVITSLGGDPYQASLSMPGSTSAYQSQLKPGEILVKDKSTGQIGAIPEKEFNFTKYTKL